MANSVRRSPVLAASPRGGGRKGDVLGEEEGGREKVHSVTEPVKEDDSLGLTTH